MGIIKRNFANNILSTGKFDATQLTGDIPTANLSANAPATDLNPLKNDVATLALREAVNANRIGTNLVNSFIDQFEDASGISTNTNSSRNSLGEYVSSLTQSETLTELDWFTPSPSTYQINAVGMPGLTSYTDVTSGGGQRTVDVDTANTTSEGGAWGHSGGNTGTIEFYADFKETKRFSGTMKLAKNNNWGDIQTVNFAYSLDGSTWTSPDLSSIVQSGSTTYGTSGAPSGGGLQSSSGTSGGNFTFNQNNTGYTHISCFTSTGWPTFDARYFRFQKVSLWSAANNNVGGIYFTPYYYPLTANATGNFISTTINPADSTARTKLGLIVLYKDNYGTNALNTDIVAQVSADNGSNYSTCTLTPRGNFDSSGTKIAIANDVAVTSGTDLKYKISFANQSDGSKEARITGVSLIY